MLKRVSGRPSRTCCTHKVGFECLMKTNGTSVFLLGKSSNRNRDFSPRVLSDSEHAEAEESSTEAEEDSTDLQVKIEDELPESSLSQ